VWRCISRLEFGTKYCRNSPTLEEGAIQDAITNALKELASFNPIVLETLKTLISMSLCQGDCGLPIPALHRPSAPGVREPHEHRCRHHGGMVDPVQPRIVSHKA